MKKFILIIALFIPIIVSAQVKRPRNLPSYDFKKVHFGFTVGLNTMDLGIRRSLANDLVPDESTVEPGFQVSIISDLRINDDLNREVPSGDILRTTPAGVLQFRFPPGYRNAN